MSTDATITMVIGMLAVWGGLAASVTVAVRSHRAQRRAGGAAVADGDPSVADGPTGDDHEGRG